MVIIRVERCVRPSRLVATLLAGIILGPLGHAGGLNDTGQTRCYDAAGSVIPCTASPAADDGRYGRDAASGAGAMQKIGAGRAGFDFTKIANDGRALPAGSALGAGPADWACTRDNATGLTWEVKTPGASHLRSTDLTYFWYDPNPSENGGNPGATGSVNTCNGTLPPNQCNTQMYVAAVNAAALCGHTDWRLPTPRELRTIVDYADAGAAISVDSTFLPNVRLNRAYWTAATYAPDPRLAWVVEIGALDGGGDGHAHGKTADTHSTGDEPVILVRGPRGAAGGCGAGTPRADLVPSTPSDDFVDHGDGTVTHFTTGLTWKRCVEGLSGAACATGDAVNADWASALAAAENSTFAGFTDWRLPNLKELHSIVEICGYDPAINTSIFPNTPMPGFGSVFWTSTTYAAQPADAWIGVFGRGGVVATGKNSRLFVRLVRGGRPADAFDAQNPTDIGRRRRLVRR